MILGELADISEPCLRLCKMEMTLLKADRNVHKILAPCWHIVRGTHWFCFFLAVTLNHYCHHPCHHGCHFLPLPNRSSPLQILLKPGSRLALRLYILSLRSSNVHLISVQAHSCLKTFVRALPKAWGSLSPDFCRTRLFHYTGPSIQIAFSSDYSIPVYNAPFLSLCLPPPISQEFSP